MERPQMHIHHADTGLDEVREMNDEEYAQYLIDIEPIVPASDDAGAPSTDAG